MAELWLAYVYTMAAWLVGKLQSTKGTNSREFVNSDLDLDNRLDVPFMASIRQIRLLFRQTLRFSFEHVARQGYWS